MDMKNFFLRGKANNQNRLIRFILPANEDSHITKDQA